MDTPPGVVSASRKAWSADSPILLRGGVLIAAAVVTFGAGVWATTMANSIATLTAHADKTDIKLEKMEGLMLEMLHEQKGKP